MNGLQSKSAQAENQPERLITLTGDDYTQKGVAPEKSHP
jgi:hypothetical protein